MERGQRASTPGSPILLPPFTDLKQQSLKGNFSHGNHTSGRGQLLIHLHFKLLFVSLKHLIGESRYLAELDVQGLEVPTSMKVVVGAGARERLSLNSN